MTVKQQQLKDILAVTLQTPNHPPIMLWGGPGIGKTAFVYQLSHSLNRPFKGIISAIYDPTDFGGIPVAKTGGVVREPMELYNWLKDNPNAIVFLDEIDKAPRAVLAALLRFVLEKQLGDYPVPPTVSIIAAANPPDEGGEYEMPTPLANRFFHLQFPLPSPRDWREAVLKKALTLPTDPVVNNYTPPVVDIVKYIAEYEKLVNFVSVFWERYPELEYKHPTPEQLNQDLPAFPSPRSWQMFCKIGAAVQSAGLSDKSDEYLWVIGKGTVGEAATTAFLNFVAQLDLPDPIDILTQQVELPQKSELLYLLTLSIPTTIINLPDPVAGWKLAWNLVLRIERERGRDYALLLAQELRRKENELRADPATLRSIAVDVLKQSALKNIILS